MGQVLHGSAKTTHAIRAAIQRSQASIKELSERYDLNPKTVAKWKKRDFIDDAPMGPKDVHSTVLSVEEEALAVAFRKHTLLPLDDCLYALQATIPQLTRSSLHRCLQRHGMSRLPDMAGDRPKKRFKTYPIGYFHIDIAEVRTEEGRLYLFVAVDRTSKFAHAELHEKATRKIAAAFLQTLIEIVPYRVHTVLTDNGIQFTDLPRNRTGPTARYSVHLFDRVCNEHGIEHRLTKPNHPWTNGQVERMNRTLKEATVKKYHYETHQNLRDHLQTFLMAYNFAKRLKTLKGLTSYEFICKCWTEEPKKFRLNPMHHTPGLNTYARLFEVTDAGLLAQAAVWAASAPEGRNEVFNITNGDFFRWCHIWPKIAGMFAMEVAPPQPISLVETMADKGPVWDAIVARHGLKAHAYEDIVQWGFGDFCFNLDYDLMQDRTKARLAGFSGALDSEEMFARMFAEFRRDRIIPENQCP